MQELDFMVQIAKSLLHISGAYESCPGLSSMLQYDHGKCLVPIRFVEVVVHKRRMTVLYALHIPSQYSFYNSSWYSAYVVRAYRSMASRLVTGVRL